MKLSFGMIVSIILIIIFIAFAFFAIKKFLEIQEAVKIGKFKDNLQADVDKMWGGQQGSQEKEYFLPKKIQYVCFVNYLSSKKGENQELYSKLKQVYYGEENMIFYPLGSAQSLEAVELKHLNMEKITSDENPYCIAPKNGKVQMKIQKKYEEALVEITR